MPHWSKQNWLFVSFGESHLTILSLTDCIARSLCSKLHFPGQFNQKRSIFIQALVCMASSGGGSLHPLTDVTKSANDPRGLVNKCGNGIRRRPPVATALSAGSARLETRGRHPPAGPAGLNRSPPAPAHAGRAGAAAHLPRGSGVETRAVPDWQSARPAPAGGADAR
jgi:hypothetical protein